MMFNHNEIDAIFKIIMQNSGQDPYNTWIPTHNWKPPLIIDGINIDSITANHPDDINLIWYNEDMPEPLNYYNKNLEIKPNKNLIIYLFGSVS